MEKISISEVHDVPKQDFTLDDTGPVYRKIIELHTIDNEPSGSKCYPRNSYPGGNKKNNFPLRRDVGEQIFNDKDKSTVAEFYIACVAHVKNFKACNSEAKNWVIKGDLALEHILVQSFFTWVLSCDKSNKNFRNKKFLKGKKVECGGDSFVPRMVITENGASNQAAEAASGKVPITKPQKIRILRQLIKINFPQQMKIWPLVFKTLSVFSTLLDNFIDEVGEIALEGNASFSTLEYCLNTSQIARCFGTPNFIIQAVLLGPLSGHVVESFLSEKAIFMRDEAKKLLEDAEGWMTDRRAYEAAVQKFAHKPADDASIPEYHIFISNIRNLLRDLRRDNAADSSMSISYAYSTLKRVAQKTYVEQVFIPEQLNDVLHSILCQHPSVKSFVVKMLRNDYCDERAANHWQKFSPQYHHRCKMSNVFEKVDFHEEPKPGCLSLDPKVEVFIVDTVNKLKILENEIARCEKSSFPCIGLDSEWNPFLSPSKAVLLQIAFPKTVYLVDLESLRGTPLLAHVLDKLFFGKSFKIGFQFFDDLVAIRESVPMIESLYKPENVVCVGKLINQLIAQSKVASHSLIDEFFPKSPKKTIAVQSYLTKKNRQSMPTM
uniref:3'-5' exonuclease domain-containing protein n=1 Tax=Ditylenchus dipsaci TaxID=166011 RepID=A0A915DSR2_9BILA